MSLTDGGLPAASELGNAVCHAVEQEAGVAAGGQELESLRGSSHGLSRTTAPHAGNLAGVPARRQHQLERALVPRVLRLIARVNPDREREVRRADPTSVDPGYRQ